ncbi:MAG TPA: serine/threonine-protein kinase, partial [Polyangiaceae bacterium]|nr:serine/threonine-protein kinase [Polyangiaceae bacterium]
TSEGVVWFAMEFLSGQTLRHEVYYARGLALQRALRFGVEIAEGVQAAHALGVIHRDLKPENVFVVQPADEVRVLDFGTSKFTRTSAKSQTTDRMRIMGTQAYMPPERLLGNVVDFRSDVYSLGHILYEMVSGVHCFSEGAGPLDLPGVYELGIRQIQAEPVPLTERKPGTPADVSAIVQRALAKKPSERQQSMQELIHELSEARERLKKDPSAASVSHAAAPDGFDVAEAPRRRLAEGESRDLERPGTQPAEVPTAIDTMPLGASAHTVDAAPVFPVKTETLDSVPAPPVLGALPTTTAAHAVHSPPAGASHELAFSLVGAARFASLRPEPSQFEQALLALTESHDGPSVALVQSSSLVFVRAPQHTHEWVRAALIALAFGVDEERQLASQVLEPVRQSGGRLDENGGTGLLNEGQTESDLRFEVLHGVAGSLPPEQRDERVAKALAALAAPAAPSRDLVLAALVAFTTLDPRDQDACRSGLVRAVLGAPDERDAAQAHVYGVLRSARAPWSHPIETTETPATMSTPAGVLAQPLDSEGELQRGPARRKKLSLVAVMVAALCLMIAGAVALVKRAPSSAQSAIGSDFRERSAKRATHPRPAQPALVATPEPAPSPQASAASAPAQAAPSLSGAAEARAAPPSTPAALPVTTKPPQLRKASAVSKVAENRLKSATSAVPRARPQPRPKHILPSSGL